MRLQTQLQSNQVGPEDNQKLTQISQRRPDLFTNKETEAQSNVEIAKQQLSKSIHEVL